ncbi:MAG: M12 family metallopeptidase [Bacteroidota bacterium]
MRNLLLALLFLFGMSGIVPAQTIHTCTEMPVAPFMLRQAQQIIPQAASRAVGYKPKYGLYWDNGSTIKVRFLGGTEFVRDRVRYYAKMWSRYANVDFRFVNYGQADIRVSFTQDGSSWSVIGRQSQQLPQSQATMNFGWLNDNTPEYEFRRTILHEFGHALGLLHEHQNPSGGIPWDEEAVYAYYNRTQGWDKQTTFSNVIQKVSRNTTQYSNYDPRSIMHYPVSASLTDGQYQIGMNRDLSATDIAYIRKIYPGRNVWTPDSDNSNNPPPVVAEKPKPAQQRFFVTVTNQLGESQVREKIDLYLGGQKYTFDLRNDGQKKKAFRFRMAPGNYNYRLVSESTYRLRRKVWNGWRYVYRNRDRTIRGGGSGTLAVSENADMTFYGNYDAKKDRLEIYIGEVQTNQLANVRSSRLSNVRAEMVCGNN